MGKRGRQVGLLGLAAVVLALGLVASAGAETTRADYIAQAEPICQQNTDANRHILKGVRKRAKRGELGKAARQFSRAAGAFAATVANLEALPRPSADAETLANWFGYLELERGYLYRISTALRREQRGRAAGLAVRLQRTANLANDTVVGFGFRECLIDPSNFT
jgi:hypothetical protein